MLIALQKGCFLVPSVLPNVELRFNMQHLLLLFAKSVVLQLSNLVGIYKVNLPGLFSGSFLISACNQLKLRWDQFAKIV